MGNIKYTPHDKVNFLTLHFSGMPKKEIARRYWIDKRDITLWEMRWRTYGLSGLNPQDYRRLPAASKAEIVRQYLSGEATMRSLAVCHGVSLSTLKSWVVRHRREEFLRSQGASQRAAAKATDHSLSAKHENPLCEA